MAYRNLVNVSCASITEVFRHVKDFLISRNGIADYSASGLGWTLHDSSFAVDQDNPASGDWIVLYSPGEDGKKDLYYSIKFVALASSILQTRSGLYWNATTNAWVLGYPGSDQSNGPTTGSAFTLWVYGSLDRLYIVIGNGSANYGRAFGMLVSPHDATTVLTTAAVSAGSNVVVPVASVPASWAVGKAIFVRDNAGIERAVISAIDGLNVTVATLANGYASGATVARDYATFISYGAGSMVGAGRTQIGRSGLTTDAGQTITGGDAPTTIINAADPDLLNNCHATTRVTAYNASYGFYGYHGDLLVVSPTGITSGNVYVDEATGDQYRALSINSVMYLFREV